MWIELDICSYWFYNNKNHTEEGPLKTSWGMMSVPRLKNKDTAEMRENKNHNRQQNETSSPVAERKRSDKNPCEAIANIGLREVWGLSFHWKM